MECGHPVRRPGDRARLTPWSDRPGGDRSPPAGISQTAEPGRSDGPGHPGPDDRPRPGRAGGPRVSMARAGTGGGLSKPAVCPDAPRGAAHRGDHSRWSLTWQLLRAAGRPAQNLRRPGGHRGRERPSLPGARCAQSRPHGSARAADGDQRGPQGHQPLDLRPPAGPEDAGRERDAPLRSATGVHLPVRR